MTTVLDQANQPDAQQNSSNEVTSDSRQTRLLARRKQIIDAVNIEGTIRIEDLADRFEISLMTVHRDLDELVSRGILRKTCGLASAMPTSLVESNDIYRSNVQLTEKKSIALAAMDYIEPGQAIFLDDSTTVLQMAPHIPSKTPLTVITNSLILMNELNSIESLTLLGLGGQFYKWCNAFMGRVTTNEIAHLRADVLIMSMSAIIDDVVFHQFPEMVETKRAMFKSASKRILLADHTKFEQRALHGFMALTEFDVVIVDDAISSDHLKRLRTNGVNVVVAG